MKCAKENKHFITCAPKNTEEAEQQDLLLQKHGLQIDVFIELILDDKVCAQRILERAKESTRKDDNIKSIQGRIDNFNNLSKDIREFFQKQSHIHYLTVDVSSTPDQIVAQILSQLKTLEKKQQEIKQTNFQKNNEIEFFQSVTGTKRAELMQHILELTQGPEWNEKAKFPATQPVPLHTKNLSKLEENLHRYRIVRKLDGERRIFIVHAGSIFFLSRSFEVVKDTSLQIPSEWNDSVFDGEITTLHDTKQLCFFIFDCMVCSGENICKKKLNGRLQSVNHFCESVNSIPTGNEHFPPQLFIQPQIYYEIQKTKSMIRLKTSFVPVCNKNCALPVPFTTTLQVPADGLIFIPEFLPYHFGSSHLVLKWKYPELMTLDFSIFRKTDEQNNEYLDLNAYQHNTSTFVSHGKLFPIPQALLRAPDGTIVECLHYRENDTWEFQRIRTDRAYPNAEWVVKDALGIDFVSEDTLIRLCSMESKKRNRYEPRGSRDHRDHRNHDRANDRSRAQSSRGRNTSDRKNSNSSSFNSTTSGTQYVPPHKRAKR